MTSSYSFLHKSSYDVFPSFSGEDVRKSFLSHFLNVLEGKSIVVFKDNEIERSRSIIPKLVQAIRDSRIAVVVFSKKYASSSWCLDELLEILKCKEKFGQMVIPIFYGLDPSDLRKQSGEFEEAFKKTCRNQTEEVRNKWKQALTDVANIPGYISDNYYSEAAMIEEISSDILVKRNLTPSDDFEDFVGIEDHLTNVRLLLHLGSEKVRMVGIWGTLGIGKTTIARALFTNLSSQFQKSVFIDRAFISKSMEGYGPADPDDDNMKLRLRERFLSEILDEKSMEISAMEERLKHQKVLIIIDDLDDQDVLDALVGRTQWFGSGSRIIVVTENKHFLRAHGIDHVYEACLPSEELALEMFCRYAFRKNSPPDGFMELSSEVALRAGNLPLGLKVLGSYLRGRDKEDWMDMMPRLRNDLDRKIEKTLRVSYDGLNNKKDEAIFRHIACLFNGEKVNDIKLLLADSDLDVNIGLKNLVDKSLVYVREDTIEMHRLLQDMGKEIVCAQSNEPGEREFLVDSKHICDVLEDNTGTKKVIGIALDINETDGLYIHESAFKGMRNLLFLNFYTKQKKDVRWHLSEGFDHLPPKLRLLSWEKYPLRFMPSNFRPENLVKLQMCESKLEKLWDGVHSLTGLRNMDLRGSKKLKEIPDLSMATNLETLKLSSCSSLVELPSTIQYLNKLNYLDMSFCKNLEILPTGINLQSLNELNLQGCSRLRSFPCISTNISELNLSGTSIEELPSNLRLHNLIDLRMGNMRSEKLVKTVQLPTLSMTSPSLSGLWLSDIPSLVELPSSIQNLHKLEVLSITKCINLETLPTGINLRSLDYLNLRGCLRLKTFPDISTNISWLNLSETGIEEVPWWIENFSRLQHLKMVYCNKLKYVSLKFSKLQHLWKADFSNCGALTEVTWNDSPSAVTMETVYINFFNCFNLDQEALLQQPSFFFESMILSGEEVPSYFTHRTTGNSLTNIPLLQTSPLQPSFKLRACAIVNPKSIARPYISFSIQVCCRFIDRLGNHFESADFSKFFKKIEHGSQLLVFDCRFTVREDNAPLAELNYDHVDIQFHLIDNDYPQLILKGCGIYLPDDGPSLDDRTCNPNILPHNFEGDNSTKDNLDGAKYYGKSIWGDNFLDEVNSDATSNSQKSINKRVGPVKEENKHGKVSKSSTMVTNERHMPQHQVFINFWGEEVRFSFIRHLVSAFSREGVNVFIETNEKRGEDDLEKTFQSIEDSKIALVVFSSKYTESRWCLNQLVKIKERMDERKLLIIPIFYKVEPSQVKELEGDFGLKLWNLWRIHRDHRIIKWKDALESVAATTDFCLKEHSSSECEFITLIVEKVLSSISSLEGENPSFISTSGRRKTTRLSPKKGEKHESFLKKNPLFGHERRMKQLEQKLEFDCNETRIIGVVGMACIGKTTLAMMLHEKWNCKFVRCVPLLDIRKMSEDYKPAWLRKTLLEVLLGGKFPVINDKTTHESLKDKLLKTKVFVVLDDVSNKKQLKFLLGDLNWIKKGSKVVITSRDKSLIEEFVHDTYVVPPLNYGEALQLFSYHAFGDHVVHPSVTSTKLCREFLDCAGGNPLIIKLLGKQLHGRDEAQLEIRQGDLTHLGRVILDIFRSSCDELSAKQKDVFLDIACFFRSENDYFVRSLMDSGDHNATDTESEVRDLTHKCMIAISGCRVEMHDLLYMLGKIFSSQALVEENGGESRLWYTREIIDALTNQKDTKNMRGIFLDMAEVTERMVLPRLTFIHMINLRYLKIYDSCCPWSCKALCKLYFPDGVMFPLDKVRYLHWKNFPLEELPSDFRPENLVDLRLPYSLVERVWQGVKDTPQLKWVDLSHSSKLLNLSGLEKAESLQRLNLEGCTNLDELPGEMQNMKSLVYLNLRGCIRLSSLPKMNLISLKTLILSSCSNLREFQVISKSLAVLHLDGTSIRGLPPSIENLQRLVVFNLKNCKMLESLPNCLGQLKVLEELILSGCSRLKNFPDIRQSMKHVQILLFDGTGATEMPKISCFTGSNDQDSVDMVLQLSGSYLSEWPRGLDGVSSLRRLCLSGNDFASLQNDIGQLYNLIWLDVKQCKKLRSIPMLPPRLQYFDAHGCDSLEKVASPLAVLQLTEQVHAMFNFSNCNKLDQDAQDSIISYTRQRSQLMLGALSRYNGGITLEPLVGTCFPGWEVPEWFSHRGSGSVLQPKLSPRWCDNRFTGIALCAVILFSGYHEQRNCLLVNCDFEFENEDGSSIHFSCTVGGWNELSNTPQKMELSHVFIGYTSRLDISKQGGYDDERCFCSKSSLEFQVTDGTEKVVGCEVLQCGFSLVYATDDRENIYGDAKTVVVPKRVKNVPGEEMSYGNSRRDDDFQYQSYSGPTLRRDENFLSERKSDATQNLRKSFGNRRFDLYKNPGGEVTISSHHYNTPTENVEKSSLVGVELRLKQLEKVLYSTPGKTRIVGVIGMPGIGKTTLAKLLFEKRGCKFPRNFFLTVSKDYISEELKRTYLEELLKHSQNISEETTNESVKDKLLQTKVFVVLNNVSDKKQLEFLLGNLNWINKGSKIVVTASDKSLVEGLAHETYVVPHLNNREAFKVFSYHAFDGKICIPKETFLSLSILFVDNVGGNPLALKLLGSELCGKDEAYWKHKLQTVIQNSNTNIQDVWRLYTDQLTERHKGVLLDIACFFRSEDEYFIKSLLDSGDPDSTDVSEVRDLAEKFLITICDGRVEMNDRHYTFCKDLGSRGGLRLWKYSDILDELRKMKQLEANNDVRGIFFDMSEVIKSIALERTTFINMHNLRYLKIYESCCPRKGRSDCKLQFPDGVDFPLEEVRYFHWLKYPLEELPPDFRPENLVDLRLPYSKIKHLWKGVKDIPRLKWVDLSHSSKLLNLSGLAKAGSLQRLNMEGCTNLDELPGEMQNMKSLVYLNMRGCIRLRSLPKMNLTSLKTLILSDCSNLKEFQVISNSLEVLHLDGTAIKGLPLAIQKLERLVVLNLKNCKLLECLPNCLGELKDLEEIILSGCSRLKNLPDVRQSMKHVQILLFDGAGVDEMPNVSCFIGSEGKASVDMSFQNFGSYGNPSKWPRRVNRVSSLRRLCLSGNDFVSLQNDIGQLYNLIWLDVKQCKKLRSVPMLPPRLQYFDAHGCDSLERVANPLALQVVTEQIHATYNFSNCNKLDQDATDAIISYTRWKSQLILDARSRYNGGFALQALIGTCFPGWEVPTWFSYRATGSLLEPKLPPHWFDSRFTGIALCAVILFPAYQNQRNNLLVKCNCEVKNEDGSRSLFSCPVGGWSVPGEKIESSHVFIGYTSKLDIKKLREDNEEGCVHTEASFEFQVTDGTKDLKGCKVLKCGFSLVYESDDLQVNFGEHETTIEANQDITSSSGIQDFFGYIFLAFSCVIIFAILGFGVIVFAPQYYMSFSDFYWPLLARILFFVAFGLFLK